MMQKILANPAVSCWPGIQSQLSEESLVIQSGKRPPVKKVHKNVTFSTVAVFLGKKGSLGIFGAIKHYFLNNATALKHKHSHV